MKTIKDAIQVYHELSFGDRLIVCLTLSSDMDMQKTALPEILEEARPSGSRECSYCHSSHIVRNGHRKDGTQRFLCKDCRRSFTLKSDSFISGSHKHFGIWLKYLSCMAEKKTLKRTAESCGISMGTAFTWRHKILAALKPSADRMYLEGTVEADETYFNVSYKGNHTRSRDFVMPRKAHRRGGSVHSKGLSFEKVCVACAVNKTGTAVSSAAKTGKVSTECLEKAFRDRIIAGSVLCTDHEKAYIGYAAGSGLTLLQMDTDRSIKGPYGIQRINAYHSRLKHFTDRFHGISTKYLDHYLTWHDRMLYFNTAPEEQVRTVLDLCFSYGKYICARDISKMPPVPILYSETDLSARLPGREASV